MPKRGPVSPNGPADRRGFPRLNLLFSVKIEVNLETSSGSVEPAAYGVTSDISRGGCLATLTRGVTIPDNARCLIRFFDTHECVEPEMIGGVVRGVRETSLGTAVGIEFDTPLMLLKLPLSSQPQAAPAGPLKILVIDDERSIGEVLARFLSREDSVVKIATDGEEGLLALRQGRWDALLLDLYLPKVNGLEVLEHIRREKLPVGVILTMSGTGDHEAAQESLRLGAHDFLVKPLSLEYVAWTLYLRLGVLGESGAAPWAGA